VRDCTFENTDAGIRMKAARGSGGLVEDCTYERLTMKRVKTPIYITSYYPESGTPKAAKDDPAQPITDKTPAWRNIRISHLTATESPTAGKIIGLAEMPVDGVTLDHVQISADKGFTVWNAKNIRFVDSSVAAKKGQTLMTENAEVTGLANQNP
jgi:polygalacturonase